MSISRVTLIVISVVLTAVTVAFAEDAVTATSKFGETLNQADKTVSTAQGAVERAKETKELISGEAAKTTDTAEETAESATDKLKNMQADAEGNMDDSRAKLKDQMSVTEDK